MKRPLTTRQHAALALALLGAGIAAMVVIIVLPALASRQAFQDRLGELQLHYQRFNALARQTPNLKRTLEELRSAPADQTGFLEEQAPALAGAALQKKIKEHIEASGASLVSAQVAAPGKQKLYPSTTIQVQMRGDVESLRDVLYSLAADPMLLQLDNILIQSRHAARAPARQGGDVIEARFDVTAFIYQSTRL